MKRRMMSLGLLGLGLLVSGLSACGSDGANKPEMGTLKVPLSTQGPSGTTYRLRDAVFEINNQYYGYAGEGGEAPATITVSSEDDPDAAAISVSVERGYSYVRLRPGWRLEKVEGGSASDVQATLLSNDTQWVYVSPHSTSWVTYQFGLGERSIWFNGELNIQVEVYEKPSDLYGQGGQGGWSDVEVGGAFGGSP